MCLSVVGVEEGTQDPEPGRQGFHLCFCHGLAVCLTHTIFLNLFLLLFSLKNRSEDRDFQVLLCMKDGVWVWTWKIWAIN